MQNRQIGPFSVANVALGCMNFCHAYGSPVSTEQSHAVLHAALDAGVTLFDTAALYGFGASESLVGPVLKPHRNHITLASKGNAQSLIQVMDINGKPEEAANAERILKLIANELR